MPKKRPLTAQQIKDWENHCDDVDGKFVPINPENINIARVVDETITQFGFKDGVEFAAFRSENAHHEVDRDDWKEVERIIRERQEKDQQSGK
jgi:hypothetical protein